MPSPLVECIPNFSEARRPEIIDQINQSILAVQGVQVLDRHSDLDHNRTVITFVGPPAAVEEAAFQAIACAGKLIDLNTHSGEHPRIGATDVVPFVPISDVTMEECIEMARRLGKRVGLELEIPVYLYEQAATRPDRQNLENIRRGQFEGLKVEIQSQPDRAPDFGPAVLGPAGASVIGARQPLVAYNVYLASDDVGIAQKVAKAVRNSSGGMHYVKAMGVLVNGLAQVTMNFTNYRSSPIYRVVELIRREAARYGVTVHHSELVGLIPQEALVDSAVWYLQLDEFNAEQILEKRLFEALAKKPELQSPSLEPTFLDQLASATPTPGGGSAAAFSAAEGAALVAMVARLTVGKKKYAAVEAQMWPVIEAAEALRGELVEAVRLDSEAFLDLLAANRLPKTTPEEAAARDEAVQQATWQAAQVPLATAEKALAVMRLAVQLAQAGNLNAISDALSGFLLARSAMACAGLNVRINCQGLASRERAAEPLNRMGELEKQSKTLEAAALTALHNRTGILTNGGSSLWG